MRERMDVTSGVLIWVIQDVLYQDHAGLIRQMTWKARSFRLPFCFSVCADLRLRDTYSNINLFPDWCRTHAHYAQLTRLFVDVRSRTIPQFTALVKFALIILITRLHQFASSLLYNATAGGALWWLRKSHIVNYAKHQHSPFASRRHDFRQAAARRFKLHSPLSFGDVSWKFVQPFPRTVVS